MKQNTTDQAVLCMTRCLICIVSCLEKFVKFFNKHAYVEVALNSTNFCTSAANGMKVVTNNFLRFGILHGLGEIVMNVVVLFITLVGVALGYMAITVFGPEKRPFNGTAGTLIIIALIMLCVANIFAHVWEVSSDTILHCHCIDENLEGGYPRNSTGRIDDALAKVDHANPKKTGFQ